LRALEMCARLCALAGGLLLVCAALLTCASITGRSLLGISLAGDFELSGAAAGVAIAMFMPVCHLRGGNIRVDAFTTRLSAGSNALLDRLGALAVGTLMALLAWRTSLGALEVWSNHSASMLLGLPDWVVFAGMAPPFALTAAIALWQGIAGGHVART